MPRPLESGAQHRRDLVAMLEYSQASALMRLEVLETAGCERFRTTRQIDGPDDGSGPLGRLRRWSSPFALSASRRSGELLRHDADARRAGRADDTNIVRPVIGRSPRATSAR